MKYINECELRYFPAWSGGRDTLATLIEKGDCDSVENLIEESFSEETPTDTAVNDFLWFERDFIAQHLGYDDWDEYEYGSEEDEEEDEGYEIDEEE